MNPQDTIINKVASSGLITFDLEQYIHPNQNIVFDIKDNLYQGLILKEKDFRDFLKVHDWSQYQNKNIAITCSADAIIPTWAYMLLVAKLQPFSENIILGSESQLIDYLFEQAINGIDFEQFQDAKVVIKGCSNQYVPSSAYLRLTQKMLPFAASIMFGEPCSTVPVYKKNKS